ncbi:MAG: S8/S53 family peptidase [Myxococcota bacterium]
MNRALLLLLAACSVDTVGSHSQPLVGDPVCVETRRVGIAIGQRACPTARGDWTGAALFADPSITSRSGDPICLYEFTGAVYTANGLPMLYADVDGDGRRDRVPGEDWTDPDCLAVEGLTSPGDIVAPSQRATFHAQADRVSSFPSPFFAPVTVGILDSADTQTAPSSSVVASVNPHGERVAEVARDLACDDAGQCAIQFVSTKVLNEEGDSKGTLSRLAQAIANTTGAQILNLSVGWHPQFNTTPSGTERAAVEAVRAALNHAVCQGTLVVAAAGNRGLDVDDNTGMFYPAAFEDEGAWSCTANLANAVGALDLEDDDSLQSRDAGQPQLAAFAVGITSSGGSHPSNSGTSYGAATVSGIAALAWAHASHLDASAVVQRIYNTGVSLGRPATSCASSAGCPDIRRPSACRSLNAALMDTCPSCAPATCSPVSAGGGVMVNPPAPGSFSAPAISAVPFTLLNTPGCSNDIYGDPGDPPAISCPKEFIPVHPDDGNPVPPSGCETCLLTYNPYAAQTPWTFRIEPTQDLQQAILNKTLETVTIEVGNSSYHLLSILNSAGPPDEHGFFQVGMPNFVVPYGTKNISINFGFANEAVGPEPVHIYYEF